VMAEHGLNESLAVILDGTGYGPFVDRLEPAAAAGGAPAYAGHGLPDTESWPLVSTGGPNLDSPERRVTVEQAKIAVTGLGLVSALGCTPAESLDALRNGRSGLRPSENLAGQPMTGQVSGFDPGHYMPKKKVRRMDAVNCYVIAAARMALEQAALDDDQRRACGILVGTGFAGLTSVVKHQRRFMEEGIEQLSPIHFPTTVYNASAGLAAIELGLTGPNTTVTGVDLPAEYALLYATLMLGGGMASPLVLVGADELSEALLQGFSDLGLLADGNGLGGFVPGEGAAALLLEREDGARARGADVLGTIEGIGAGCVPRKGFGYDAGAVDLVVGQALQRAHLDLDGVGWISLGNNGSPALAGAESAAFDGLGKDWPVAALKRYTGEFAGSGALRLALGLACSRAGFIPASAGPVAHGADRPFLHLALGVGGNAAAVVVQPAA